MNRAETYFYFSRHSLKGWQKAAMRYTRQGWRATTSYRAYMHMEHSCRSSGSQSCTSGRATAVVPVNVCPQLQHLTVHVQVPCKALQSRPLAVLSSTLDKAQVLGVDHHCLPNLNKGRHSNAGARFHPDTFEGCCSSVSLCIAVCLNHMQSDCCRQLT